MADFKIGNITPLLGNLKAGSTDVIRIMNGAVQVWPIVTPSAECAEFELFGGTTGRSFTFTRCGDTNGTTTLNIPAGDSVGECIKLPYFAAGAVQGVECSQPVPDQFVFVIELDDAQPPCQDTLGVAISIVAEDQTNIVIGQTLYSTSGGNLQLLALGFYRMSAQTTLVDGNTYNISTILISNFYIQVDAGGQIISKINC
jgi:hypothetical protein